MGVCVYMYCLCVCVWVLERERYMYDVHVHVHSIYIYIVESSFPCTLCTPQNICYRKVVKLPTKSLYT